MAKTNTSSTDSPFQAALKGDFAGCARYSAPEFKTISAAGKPNKKNKKRVPKKELPNEIKSFLVDDLFMTDR